MSNLNMIEVEGETLMNLCKQVLNGEKTLDEVRDPMNTIILRLEGLLEDKKKRLKQLLSSL